MPSHKRGVLKGSKLNGRHSTFIKPATALIEAAKELDFVTKIVLGPIESLGTGGQSHMRVRPSPPAGIKLIVSGGGAVQTIYIYTSDTASTESVLKRTWDAQK